jgi:purine-nucleoside phosphorylase
MQVKNIEEARSYIRAKTNKPAEIGLILGSGLGSLADEIENAVRLDYADIPHFPVSTVHGHKGQLVIGELEGANVVAMQGRFHFYEGYSMESLVFPVRVMKSLGVNTLIVTNACGSLKASMPPGSLMLIEDHINFTGDNPLIGPNEDTIGPRFPDMSEAYDRRLMDVAEEVATGMELSLFRGVYTAVSGPYYCSKAELHMIRGFGSDAIGMSTVPEVIAASHAGLRVLGISCITDLAVPETLGGIHHEEVIRVAGLTRPRFEKLVKGILQRLH